MVFTCRVPVVATSRSLTSLTGESWGLLPAQGLSVGHFPFPTHIPFVSFSYLNCLWAKGLMSGDMLENIPEEIVSMNG